MADGKRIGTGDLLSQLERRDANEIKELIVLAAAGTPGSGIDSTELRDLFLSGNRTASGPYTLGFSFSDISQWIEDQWLKIEQALIQITPYICDAKGPVKVLWEDYLKSKKFGEIVAAIAVMLPTIPGIPNVLISVAVYIAAYLVKVGLPA